MEVTDLKPWAGRQPALISFVKPINIPISKTEHVRKKKIKVSEIIERNGLFLFRWSAQGKAWYLPSLERIESIQGL